MGFRLLCKCCNMRQTLNCRSTPSMLVLPLPRATSSKHRRGQQFLRVRIPGKTHKSRFSTHGAPCSQDGRRPSVLQSRSWRTGTFRHGDAPWQHTCSSRLSTEGFWQLCSPGLVVAVMSYVTMCETSPNTAEAFKLGEFQDSFELANKALEVRGERPRTLIARFAVWARLTPSTLRARSSLSSSRHTSPRSEGVPTEQFASQAPGTSVAQTCSLTPSGCSFRGRRKLAGCLQLRAGALKGCCALHSENGTTPLPTMPPARSRTCMAAST